MKGLGLRPPSFSSSGITDNVLQIAEGGEYEALNLIKPQMLNRSTTLDITTKPPLLAMCCYALLFFTNSNL